MSRADVIRLANRSECVRCAFGQFTASKRIKGNQGHSHPTPGIKESFFPRGKVGGLAS